MCYYSGVSVVSHNGEIKEMASFKSPVLPYTGNVCLTLNISTTPSMVLIINEFYSDVSPIHIADINTMNVRVVLSLTLTANQSQVSIALVLVIVFFYHLLSIIWSAKSLQQSIRINCYSLEAFINPIKQYHDIHNCGKHTTFQGLLTCESC